MFRLNKDPLPEFDDLSEMEENSSHSSKMFRTVSGASRKNSYNQTEKTDIGDKK